jgi:hypothetical protein
MALLPVLSMLACASVQYAVVLRNSTSEELDEVHVSYGDFRSIGGVLPPGIEKGEGGVPVPIPDRALVTWRDAQGKLHSVAVPVKSVLPGAFRSGEIYFDIQPDGSVLVWGKPESGSP